MNKVIILLFLISFNSFSQYSRYYIRSNIDINVDANVRVDKNITTIDYGALAQANAQREANRIQRMAFQSQQARQAAIAIANDPSKAFDYGQTARWEAKGSVAKLYGFKKFTLFHKVPHKSLFTRLDGTGYPYQNIRILCQLQQLF